MTDGKYRFSDKLLAEATAAEEEIPAGLLGELLKKAGDNDAPTELDEI